MECNYTYDCITLQFTEQLVGKNVLAFSTGKEKKNSYDLVSCT